MAKKSSGATKDAATPKKAGTKAAVKKTAVKKAPKATAGTASKSGTPKAAVAKKVAPKAEVKAPKKAAPKKAAAPKLNERMVEFINRIHGTGEVGYAAGKGEDKTITALSTRKLVKRGKKNADGKHHYTLTKTGQKYVGGGTSPSTGGA